MTTFVLPREEDHDGFFFRGFLIAVGASLFMASSLGLVVAYCVNYPR